ncbi:hypothetical protein NMY22_g8767 [Coprinellus aureogranulatus]|nr:hypothetical protein NMY22_g8767 [Coprinellus aureogranulatus]
MRVTLGKPHQTSFYLSNQYLDPVSARGLNADRIGGTASTVATSPPRSACFVPLESCPPALISGPVGEDAHPAPELCPLTNSDTASLHMGQLSSRTWRRW